MKTLTAVDVRATISALVLGDEDVKNTVGEITLHPHQREGVARVIRLIDEHRGALLADDVGLGKTYVALAAARGADNVLVIAPASLRDAWIAAARRTEAHIRFVSIETLSRSGMHREVPDFVIIDEAHHLRSRNTRRFAAARDLCTNARVLLMSATPIQNRMEDLRAILALFLGARADGMPEHELARFVVRRVEADVAPSTRLTLPAVRQTEWLPAVRDADCLDRLVALPPPLPPSDGSAGGVLLTYTLVRQWASSRAALRASLQRRVARGCAMEDALLAGRVPSRTELTTWCYAEGTQQLVFPELAVQSHVMTDVAPLLEQVRQHLCAVRELVAWLETSVNPDVARVAALREVMAARPDERVVAFSEYADTVAMFYRALAPTRRTAMLTHGGGRVAGGPISRRDLLARFSPGASSRVSASDRVDLLLATDVLSEGVDLQEASVVVHLDLSWNPARLEQRVGRLRRIGASRSHVSVYASAPPAPAERLLQLERRLRLKLGVAARSVGIAGAILPGLVNSDPHDASAPREQRIASRLRSWRRDAASPSVSTPVAACIRSTCNGAIACIARGGATSLVAVVGDRVSDARIDVDALLDQAGGSDIPLRPGELESYRDTLVRWERRRTVSNVVNLGELHVAHSRRALLHRVDTIARRVSRHTQPRLAPLMRAARTAATAPLSAGAERVLDELSRAAMGDEAWLRAVGEFASLHAGPSSNESPGLRALLILRKD